MDIQKLIDKKDPGLIQPIEIIGKLTYIEGLIEGYIEMIKARHSYGNSSADSLKDIHPILNKLSIFFNIYLYYF